MDKETIFETLKGILQKDINLQIPIALDTALIGGQILDSLDFMNYITIVEETYSITISDDDISKYKLGILQNMVDYVFQNKA